ANAVIYAWGLAVIQGGWIGAPPMIHAAIDDLYFAVLIRSGNSVALNIDSRRSGRFRKSGIGNSGGGNPPSSNQLVRDPICSGKILLSSPDRQCINERAANVVGYVVTSRTPVRLTVIVVLERATVAIHVKRIVTQAVGHSLSIGIVHGELQSMAEALPQDSLHGVIVHRGARFRDQQWARTYTRYRRIYSNV